VERIVVTCTSSIQTSCRIYAAPDARSITGSNLKDGTSTGNFDVADDAAPVFVDSNECFIAQWSGASVGAIGTVAIQYQYVKRVAA
jgi:hypothetical protein